MITHAFDMGGGLTGFRTFTFAMPQGTAKSKTRPWAFGDLTSTKPARSIPNLEDNQDFYDRYAGAPAPDIDAGDNKFCSLHALCRASGCSDSGFARDMVTAGSLKPDYDGGAHGLPSWKAGDSANAASAKLKSAFKNHLVSTSKPITNRPLGR